MTEHTPQPQTARVLLRKPCRNLALSRGPGVGIPDDDRALFQHQNLHDALANCGVSVTLLKADPLFPDGSFINDMAVVTETLAVICNFSEDAPRQGEQKSIAAALAASHFLKFISAPGLLDARDVLRIGERFYIGLSARTNQEGAAQLAYFLMEYGYEAQVLDLSGFAVSTLRSAAVCLGGDRLLIQEDIARHYAFLAYEKIIAPHSEKCATDSLMINGTLLLPAGCPVTMDELKLWRVPFQTVNVSEFEKTGGGLSRLALCLPSRLTSAVVSLPARISHAA